MQSEKEIQQNRRQVFNEVIGAFEDKYSWLGHQTARELLLSAASWNIEQYSDPPMRFRSHTLLSWERGWLKSSILSKMASVLGDDLCSTMGKVTDAGIRGSVSNGQFTPPKPLKTPIVISTEFGQTSFEDELLNVFLALLEEGHTNITMNKVASMAETQKRDIEQRYDGGINFGQTNEFDLNTNFVFWGATYDPTKLEDDALRSRFNVVTPAKPLTGEVTEAVDNGHFSLSSTTIKELRSIIMDETAVETDFTPPSHLYTKYSLNPRESRDMQAYMACRNWWGLDVNTEIMEEYIKHLKQSRRRATMAPQERVMDIIFDSPTTYTELQDKTGYDKQHLYKILDNLNADRVPTSRGTAWAVWSGADDDEDNEDSDESTGFLENIRP